MSHPESRQASPGRTPIRVERRFPLDLRQSDQAIRALYEDAKKGRWTPDVDVPWDAFDGHAQEPAALDAARRVWSRRAWLEYTGLAETPALVIRFCLELDREADPKYFLTVRNTEEAWNVESFHRYAEACGGYLEAPTDPQWQPLFNRGLHRDALDADRSLDGHVLTHCTFGDGLEHALANAWLSQTREPVAKAILERCVGARERHARFGWLYIERRAPLMSNEDRVSAVQSLVQQLTQVEFAGARCVGLATAIDASEEMADLDRVADAGLGATGADVEVRVFKHYLADCRDRLDAIGIELPMLEHPRLGRL